MKVTDRKIAEYFGTTPQSLSNWKRSDKKELNERYEALRYWFIYKGLLAKNKMEWEDANNNSN